MKDFQTLVKTRASLFAHLFVITQQTIEEMMKVIIIIFLKL